MFNRSYDIHIHILYIHIRITSTYHIVIYYIYVSVLQWESFTNVGDNGRVLMRAMEAVANSVTADAKGYDRLELFQARLELNNSYYLAMLISKRHICFLWVFYILVFCIFIKDFDSRNPATKSQPAGSLGAC